MDIQIILNQPPSADVTFSTIQSMLPSKGVVDTSSVTFTSVDWNTLHTVRVTGVDDAIADPDMFYDIDLGFASFNPYPYSIIPALQSPCIPLLCKRVLNHPFM